MIFRTRVIILSLISIFITGKDVYAMAPQAFSACVINAATDEIIWEKNSDKQHSMASTTKIMTAVAALENCSVDEVVTVSASASGVEGSSMYIAAGEKYTLNDMLYGLMLNSGNDAAVAIAEHVSGSTEGFADEMNSIAYRIGAKNTQFINPNGLDAQGHYTTAYDLAKIASYALKNEDFKKIVSTVYKEVQPIDSEKITPLANHNKLLSSYDGCIGVKTGYTEKTGRCLVSAAERDGMMFIAVTIDDRNDWQSHKDMLDYCFENYRPVKVLDEGECARSGYLDNKKYDFLYKTGFVLPVKKDEKPEIEVKNYITSRLSDGFNAGEKAGISQIIYNGKIIFETDIISEKEIPAADRFKLKKSFSNTFARLVKNFLFN